jgi:hypothetical protein
LGSAKWYGSIPPGAAENERRRYLQDMGRGLGTISHGYDTYCTKTFLKFNICIEIHLDSALGRIFLGQFEVL